MKTQLLYVSRGATLFLQDVENIRQSSESLIFRHYPTTVIPRKIAFYVICYLATARGVYVSHVLDL